MSRAHPPQAPRSALRIHWGGRALRERFDFAIGSRLRPSPDAPLLLLCARPIVLHVRDFALRPGGPIYGLLRALRGRRVDLLLSPSWNLARRRRIERLIRLRRRLQRMGDIRITFFATDAAELAHLQGAGLPALHVNNAAFLDERIFRPLPERHKKFDAVYDARLSRFKRHPLAAQVPNLALITYLLDARVDPDYRAAVEPIVARSHVFNGNPLRNLYRRLSTREVNECLNQCAVGLALSREEGAMYASMQYLMAGLPVVSTPSEGGRADFYHPDYVRIVDPEPRAVADAVAELRECKLSAEEIHARTMAIARVHRQRLFRCVDEIYAEQGVRRGFEAEWPSVFVNQLLSESADPVPGVLAAIRAAHAA